MLAPGLATAPAAALNAPGGTAPAQAPALPSPAQQVAMLLTPLRRGPDGTHRLTIELNPDNLGPISVVAEVRGGAIAVQLHGSTEAGRAALHAALPELRQDLLDAGFGACSLDLQQGDLDRQQGGRTPQQQQPESQRSWPAPQPSAATGLPEPEPVTAGPSRIQRSALDLRV
jgi:flagellar hook-length control protein FliK